MAGVHSPQPSSICQTVPWISMATTLLPAPSPATARLMAQGRRFCWLANLMMLASPLVLASAGLAPMICSMWRIIFILTKARLPPTCNRFYKPSKTTPPPTTYRAKMYWSQVIAWVVATPTSWQNIVNHWLMDFLTMRYTSVMPAPSSMTILMSF
ncbi:hypothetical protein [Moraxella lacunata]|uniref:hypothetical protein n=1 Tax=Moraxella lacunata TaxID=477 RepID=UPI003EE20A88